MQKPKLPEIDLNLLVALHTLLETESVTRSAERLGVTQSAMSHTLRRLREMFDDPLLVRSRKGMVPTARAKEIREPLRNGLMSLEGVLQQKRAFEPARSTEEFTIVATELMQLLFLPQLAEILRREAPGVHLHVFTPEMRRSFQQLESGEVDCFVGSVLVRSLADQIPGLLRRELGQEPMVCAVRKGHPRIQGRLSLDAFASEPHILISPTGKGPGLVDAELERLGFSRRITVRLASFLMAPWVVASSDHILTAPKRVIESMRETLQLQVLEPPLEIPPIPIVLYWHEGKHADPAREWLRQAIVRAHEAASQTR